MKAEEKLELLIAANRVTQQLRDEGKSASIALLLAAIVAGNRRVTAIAEFVSTTQQAAGKALKITNFVGYTTSVHPAGDKRAHEFDITTAGRRYLKTF